MAIQFDNSNTGTVTLKPPASGSVALVLPSADGTSGQVISTDGSGNLSFTTANVPASAMPAGSVLQMVSYLTATQASQVLNGTDQVVNGITKQITPLGNNSKFLVTVRWFGEVSNGWDTPFNIHMDGVRVNIDGQGRGYGLGMSNQTYPVGNDNSSTPETLNMSTLVSTSSVIGTPITFSLVADTQATNTMWTNRCYLINAINFERGTSEIIITEIKG